MDIGLLNILKTVSWDFRRDMAQSYANALKNAIELHLPNDREKQRSFFLSKKGSTTAKGNFEDKLYVGNIHRIENHLYWNDEELAEDDEIVNVVVIDGPVTRDGGGCSYGTKDYRDMVTYANTIPQVVGHIFFINTPGGESACRNDYDMMIDDCRKNGKPTVAFVDDMCCSSGVNLASRCDRVIVMNPKDDFGCIGSMAAFWATPDGAIDRDGTRFIEIVGDDSPEKNDWYREAAEGNYEKLREIINRDTEQFHQTVRENRPLVKAEMLTGKVFEAQELIPALVDEIGDFNRAIQAVFDLAGQTLTAARFATAEPVEKPEEQPESEGQEDMAQLTEQATTPKNNNDMTEENNKKALEAAEEQPVTTQEQAPAQEESPAQEEQAPTAEGAPATEEKPAEEQTAEEPAGEAAGTEAPAQEAAVADATAEVAKITETLHTAEAMIEQKDKEIAQLNSTLEGKQNEVQQLQEALDGVRASIDKANAAIVEKDATIAERQKTIEAHVATIAEKDTAIEALKKQVSDLKAEVKELSEKPAPMVNAESGIPADNGTGDAPQQQKPRITSDMTYEEIRAMQKKGK